MMFGTAARLVMVAKSSGDRYGSLALQAGFTALVETVATPIV